MTDGDGDRFFFQWFPLDDQRLLPPRKRLIPFVGGQLDPPMVCSDSIPSIFMMNDNSAFKPVVPCGNPPLSLPGPSDHGTVNFDPESMDLDNPDNGMARIVDEGVVNGDVQNDTIEISEPSVHNSHPEVKSENQPDREPFDEPAGPSQRNDNEVNNQQILIKPYDSTPIPGTCDKQDDGNFIIDLDEYEQQHAEAKYKTLSDMFPDAETVFLQAKCSEFALNNNGFQYFINLMMIPGDYPKKTVVEDEDEDGLDDIEEENPSIKNFNVEEFLRKYPDPVDYFSNRTNGEGVAYIQHICNFLHMRYKFISAVNIRNALQKNNFNLYKTDLQLRRSRSSRKVARRPSELKPAYGKPPDEYFDLIAFLLNEKEVLQVLNERLAERTKAVEEARLTNSLIVCGCCYADDLLAQEVSNCPEGHLFCKACIRRSVEVSMGDGKLDFPCLQECSEIFDLSVLKNIISSLAFDKLERKLQEREVVAANIFGLEACPFCEYSAIPPEEARVFVCDNCKKESCRLCRKKSHVPLKCHEVDDENTKERVFVEEKMTDALLRKCYRCGTKFIREDGCNKMTCVCGAAMCYICRKPIKGYNHFHDNGTHRSSTSSDKCPLWTNNNELHKKEVNEERDKAIHVLKRKNPDLNESTFSNKRR